MPTRRLDQPIAIPDHAPPAVADAHVKHDQLVTRLAELRGDIYDARQAVTTAKADDLDAARDAALAGKSAPANRTKREDAARAKLAALEEQIEPLQSALDQTARVLIAAIGDAKDDWQPVLDRDAEEAQAAYDDAIAQLHAAADHLATAGASARWLEQFAPEDFLRGGPILHRAGRLLVLDAKDLRRAADELDARRLISHLAAAVTHREPEQPRHHGAASVAA